MDGQDGRVNTFSSSISFNPIHKHVQYTLLTCTQHVLTRTQHASERVTVQSLLGAESSKQALALNSHTPAPGLGIVLVCGTARYGYKARESNMSHMGLLISMSSSKCAEGVDVSSHYKWICCGQSQVQVRASPCALEEAGQC